MGSELELKLSDVAELKGGYAFKSGDYSQEGRFILRTVNIRDDGRITMEGATYIPENQVGEYERFSLQDQDTLFVMVGATLGKIGYVTKSDLPALLNQNMWVIRSKDQNATDPRFLNYWFQHAVPATLAWVSGSARGFVRRDDYRNLKFQKTSFPEQKAIAHILGSLDDKIELNRRMNETLEAMVQALFKSWFVDFDPVIDNALAAGNPIPEELADRAELRQKVLEEKGDATITPHHSQFPATFTHTEELGWIPERWEVAEFGSIAQNIRNGVDPATLSEETPYVGLEHIDKLRFSLSRWGYASDVDSQKSKFEVGDFLFGKLRPYFHKVCQVPSDGICSTDILVIRALVSGDSGFVGCQIFDPVFVEYANLRSTGTRMPRASWKDMSKYEVALPSLELREFFSQQIEPKRKKLMLSVGEGRVLAHLRDTLLPKLISGELRIPEAKKLAKEVPA